MTVLLASLQIGKVESLGSVNAADPMDRDWITAFLKKPVMNPVWASKLGLEGDQQADRENHGGVDKAICAYSSDHFPYWRKELGADDLGYGAFGENFSVTGLTEDQICLGDRWLLGQGLLLEVSQPRSPCWKLARRWKTKNLVQRVQETGKTGWYFRVIQPEFACAGTAMQLVERPFPEWTVTRANQVMYQHKSDRARTEALYSVPTLSASWQTTLLHRAKNLTAET